MGLNAACKGIYLGTRRKATFIPLHNTTKFKVSYFTSHVLIEQRGKLPLFQNPAIQHIIWPFPPQTLNFRMYHMGLLWKIYVLQGMELISLQVVPKAIVGSLQKWMALGWAPAQAPHMVLRWIHYDLNYWEFYRVSTSFIRLNCRSHLQEVKRFFIVIVRRLSKLHFLPPDHLFVLQQNPITAL